MKRVALVNSLSLVLALFALGCHDRDVQAKPRHSVKVAASSSAARERARPATLEPGSEVELTAKNAAGVPVHPAPSSDAVSLRLPTGSRVRLIERHEGGRWWRIAANSGAGGWITERYIARASVHLARDAGASTRWTPDASASAGAAPPHESPWTDSDTCRRLLKEGRKLERAPGTARLASWNVRWFPDGDGSGTDVPWLACSLAFIDAEAVALQEIKNTAHAKNKVAELERELNGLSGGRYRLVLDDCRHAGGQHVGVLLDERRVRMSAVRSSATVNPHGSACEGQLRPGFGVYLRWPGGFDAHFVSVHFKSGGAERSLRLRQQSVAGLAGLRRERVSLLPDADLIVAGDFNTVGCDACSPVVDAAAEIAELTRVVRAVANLQLVSADGQISLCSGQRGARVDHFLTDRAMAELKPGESARIVGFCSQQSCRAAADARALSDHCPVVLDVLDRDLD